MAKLQLKAGTTSKHVNVFIQDSSVATGAGLTGLAYNTASLSAYYHRQGAASAVSISLTSGTVGTWASGDFVAVDGTNMPGLYELGIPDNALAAGASWVVIMLNGATNMAPCLLEIELTAVDNQSATAFVTSVTLAADQAVNVTKLDGAALATHAAGMIPADQRNIDGAALATHAAGMSPADMRDILGTAVSAPATAGILDVNVKNMNNVAATSITAINANQGTTQPINFTGAGASALAKSDTVDIAGAVVNANSAQLGVNVVSQANIDFGALQKASLNAATPASVVGAVGSVAGNVVGSVGSVTGLTAANLDVAVSSRLATTGYTVPPTTGQIVAAILAGVFEGSISIQSGLRIFLAALAGKADGGGTNTIHFRDQADTLNRITLTVDADGNRSASTVDGS